MSDFETDVLVVRYGPRGRRVGMDRPDICELVPHLLRKHQQREIFEV